MIITVKITTIKGTPIKDIVMQDDLVTELWQDDYDNSCIYIHKAGEATI